MQILIIAILFAVAAARPQGPGPIHQYNPYATTKPPYFHVDANGNIQTLGSIKLANIGATGQTGAIVAG